MARLRKLLAGLLVTALLLVLGEAAAAFAEFRENGTVRAFGRPIGLYQAKDPAAGRNRMQPGAHLAGTKDVAINAWGFRGPEIAAQRPPGSVRVWVAGGSTTFDIGASDNAHTWPAQAEARLRELLPGREVEVINAGIAGEVIRGNTEDLRQIGPRLRPDVVVLYHGPNDLGVVMDRKGGGPPPPNPILANLALYRLLSDLLPAPFPKEEWAANRPTEAELAEIQAGAAAFSAEARALGARMVFASHALRAEAGAQGWSAWYGVGREAAMRRLRAEDYVWAIDRINADFAATAQREGAAFVDLRAVVPPDRALFDDGIHFVDAGSALAGRALAEALVAQSLVR